jgi:hypothetical protein
MILALGLALWLPALAAAGRLLVLARRDWLRSTTALLLAGLVAAGAVWILFRPHEDLYGGEDPGAYVNSALTYARTGAFFHIDPLLADVPLAHRPAFFYGHRQFGLTKDACLWVRDLESALIGPRFLPAYPLLMSALARLGPDATVLYVTPFFALLTALALAVLAGLAFPGARLAPLAAPVLYLLCPLVFWHGRCPRPELPASFFLFAGTAFLLHAWRQPRWRAWPDILSAGLCVGLAPFFHPTAWQFALPLGLLAATLILAAGRDDFVIYLPAAAALAGLFLFQQASLTDAYRVLRHVPFAVNHPATTALMILLACAALGIGSRLLRRRLGNRLDAPWPVSDRTAWGIRAGLLGLTLLAVLAACLARSALVRILPGPVSEYLVPTDFETLSRMISWPVALLVLLGWIAWWLDPDAPWMERAALGLAVLPAILLTGLVVDFMSTRYYVLTIIPVAVLALTGLVVRVGRLEQRRWSWPLVSMPLLVLLAALQVHGRLHLMTLVEHRGFHRFLAGLAAPLQRPNVALLAEYSRLAAPFHHFFGIPTLGLDQHRHDSYEDAEWSWELILRHRPEIEAYFLTPFQPPASDRFVFEPVTSRVFPRIRLLQARLHLPTRVREDMLQLSLYRMRLRLQPGIPPDPVALPYSRILAEGNMGLRGFGPTLHKDWFLPALPLTPNEPVLLPFPTTSDRSRPREGVVLLQAEPGRHHPRPPLLEFDAPIESYRERWSPLPGGWWAMQFAGAAPFPGRGVWLRARDPMVMGDILFLDSSNLVSTLAAVPDKSPSRVPLNLDSARWTRTGASFFLPAAGPEPALFLALLAPPPKSQTAVALKLSNRGVPLMPPLTIEPGSWHWHGAILPRGALAADAWVRTDSEPTWHPDDPRYPADLGPLMACFAVLPILAPESDPIRVGTSLEGRIQH